MPQKFVVDRTGLRNKVVDNNPLKPNPTQVMALRKQNRGMDTDRATLLKQIEEEENQCPT